MNILQEHYVIRNYKVWQTEWKLYRETDREQRRYGYPPMYFWVKKGTITNIYWCSLQIYNE